MKIRIIAVVITLVISAVVLWLYVGKSVFRTKASVGRVNISLLTDTGQNLAALAIGDSFKVDMVLQSDISLTGVDLHTVFYNSSQAIDYVSATQEATPYFEEPVANRVINFSEGTTVVTAKKRVEFAAVTKKADAALLKTATIHYIFKAVQNGLGIVRVRQDFSQVSGVGGLLQVCKTGSVNCGSSDTDNDIALINIAVGTTTTITPTITAAPGSIKLALKLKFQGISTTPNRNTPVSVKVKLGGGPSNLAVTGAQTVQFTPDANGIYAGNTSFDVPVGSGYYVLIKGDSHVQKKVCQSTPTETSTGTYRCGTASIQLQNGDNTLDFSSITLLAGDLNLTGGQDGVVDSQDIGYIRQNLGSTDANVIVIGDINHDGNINQQDMSLILASLSIKVDEE